jgi:hypothetical protein
MLRTIALLVGVLCGQAAMAAAECIEVQDSQIEELETDYGITSAEWMADIHNHCDEPHDATLTIKFLDDDGDVVHESLEVVIVESRGIEKARHPLAIPDDRFAAIKQIKVDIEERARPI